MGGAGRKERGAHSWVPSVPSGPAPTNGTEKTTTRSRSGPTGSRPRGEAARARTQLGDPEGPIPLPGATWRRPCRSPAVGARPPPALTPPHPGTHGPPLTSWSSRGASGALGLCSGWDAPSGVRSPPRPLGPGPAPSSSSSLRAEPHLPKGVSGGTWEPIRTQGGVRAPGATSGDPRSGVLAPSASPAVQESGYQPPSRTLMSPVVRLPIHTSPPASVPSYLHPGGRVSPSRGPWSEPQPAEWPPSAAASARGAQG